MRSDSQRIERSTSCAVSALRWAACSVCAAGVLWMGGATGSDAQAALGSPRDGASCKAGHAFVAEMGVNGLTSGDDSLVAVTKKIVSRASEDGSEAARIRIGGKRRSSKIVLCHGTYHSFETDRDGNSRPTPGKRFEVGPRRGDVIVRENGDLVVRIYARLKR